MRSNRKTLYLSGTTWLKLCRWRYYFIGDQHQVQPELEEVSERLRRTNKS